MLSNADFPDVEIAILNWYNSAIRLTSYNRNTLCELGGNIVEAWKEYCDETVGVFNSKKERHNTCTPIVRYLPDGKFCLEIILRNNVTSEEFPGGVFHAHPEYHNIKKEGIGLIEAMGLFILPGRLKQQLNDIADILCKNVEYNSEELAKQNNFLFVHKDMVASLVKEGYAENKEIALNRVTNYVNETCKNILFNTAVFKPDENGNAGFERFLKVNGIN
jgi:UDPglucose--hexose-1-phosphate uridylyltransferase